MSQTRLAGLEVNKPDGGSVFSQDLRVFPLFFQIPTKKIPVFKAALGRYFHLFELPKFDFEYEIFGNIFENGAVYIPFLTFLTFFHHFWPILRQKRPNFLQIALN